MIGGVPSSCGVEVRGGMMQMGGIVVRGRHRIETAVTLC